MFSSPIQHSLGINQSVTLRLMICFSDSTSLLYNTVYNFPNQEKYQFPEKNDIKFCVFSPSQRVAIFTHKNCSLTAPPIFSRVKIALMLIQWSLTILKHARDQDQACRVLGYMFNKRYVILGNRSGSVLCALVCMLEK